MLFNAKIRRTEKADSSSENASVTLFRAQKKAFFESSPTQKRPKFNFLNRFSGCSRVLVKDKKDEFLHEIALRSGRIFYAFALRIYLSYLPNNVHCLARAVVSHAR